MALGRVTVWISSCAARPLVFVVSILVRDPDDETPDVLTVVCARFALASVPLKVIIQDSALELAGLFNTDRFPVPMLVKGNWGHHLF